MSTMSMQEMSKCGLYVGAGIALVPAAVTLVIASSRAILINIIANAILKFLTVGKVGIDIYGLSLIQVPFLWKISTISALVGGGIVALSLTALLINRAYLRAFPKKI